MYLPSSEACNVQPNSTTPDSPADLAAAEAESTQLDATLAGANQNWLGMLSRNWQSFADQGPYVAYQLRNGTPAVATASTLTGAVLPQVTSAPSSNLSLPAVTPVNLVTQGNVTGTNPAAGGSGVGPALGQPANPASTPDDAQFIQTFGGSPAVQNYTGPLPNQGGVMSLVVGGQNRPLAVGPGAPFAATPAATGYGGDCPLPLGVSMLPWGEPAYPVSATTPGAGSGVTGVGITLAALLGLAAVAYYADKRDKKRGRAGA